MECIGTDTLHSLFYDYPAKNAAARFPLLERVAALYDLGWTLLLTRQTNAFQLPYSRGGRVLGGFHHADLSQRDGFRQVDAVYGMSPVFLRREGRRDEADS